MNREREKRHTATETNGKERAGEKGKERKREDTREAAREGERGETEGENERKGWGQSDSRRKGKRRTNPKS